MEHPADVNYINYKLTNRASKCILININSLLLKQKELYFCQHLFRPAKMCCILQDDGIMWAFGRRTIDGEKNQKVSAKWNPQKDTLSDLCGLRKLKT